MIQLTETQSELLKAALADDGGTIPITANARNSAFGLIKRGLALAVPRSDGPSWLLITSAGRQALGDASGAGPVAAPGPQSAELWLTSSPECAGSEPPPLGHAENSPKGKLALLVELLSRPEGVSIAEMIAATGWLAHSIRGAMSAPIKKKAGVAVSSVIRNGVRIYSLPVKAAGE